MKTCRLRDFLSTLLFAYLSLELGESRAFDLIHTLHDPTPTFGDFFGGALDIDQGRVLVGAPGHDTTTANVGEAHLFDSVTGELLRTFHAPDALASASFGVTVAMEGDRILIGDPGQDRTDRVHVFDAQSGELLRTIESTEIRLVDSVNPWMNSSGAVDLDGKHALIGLRRGVGLFDIETGDLLRTFVGPAGSTGSRGSGFAIEDGRVLLSTPSGRSSVDPIQAHLFDASSGELLQSFSDPVEGGYGFDTFGAAVALDGDRVLIGDYEDPSISSGQAYLFDAQTGQLLHTLAHPRQWSVMRFGMALAMDDGLATTPMAADRLSYSIRILVIS